MKRLPPPSQTPSSFESESYFERFDELVKIANDQVEAYQKLQRGPWFPGDSGIARMLAMQLAPCPEEERVDTFKRLWQGENIYEPSRDFVVKRLGLLVGSFPSVNPHSPKVYLNMLVARVMAKHPSCMALESACNELVDTFKFSTAPTIAELLALLAKHKEFWDEEYFWAARAIDSGRALEQAKDVVALLQRKEQEQVDCYVQRLAEYPELVAKLKEGGHDVLAEVREEAEATYEKQRAKLKLEDEKRATAKLTYQNSHNGSSRQPTKDYFAEYCKRPQNNLSYIEPFAYSYSDADDEQYDDDDDDDDDDC